MNKDFAGAAICLAGFAAFCLAGCTKPSGGTAKPGETAAHDHVHSGPHKGHLMELGEEEYHVEWTHDESGKVTFYILDSAAKKEVPIEADKLVIDVKIGENKPNTYELPAVNPTEGKSATFEITDKQFESVLDQIKSSGIVLTLHVNINGKQFDAPVKEHEHDH
jgi:hypothetical protein